MGAGGPLDAALAKSFRQQPLDLFREPDRDHAWSSSSRGSKQKSLNWGSAARQSQSPRTAVGSGRGLPEAVARRSISPEMLSGNDRDFFPGVIIRAALRGGLPT
jgi:hypothetical protein